MRKIFLQIILFIIGSSPLFSQQNSWTKKMNFFEAREGAATFTINNKLYVAAGNDKADLWEYDPATNGWVQKANLPAPGRSYAVGFSIGNKGYIATGSKKIPLTLTATIDSLMKDVWEYDPAVDNWTRKADFGGVRRARAVAFVLNKKAYLGSGEIVGGVGMATEYPNRVASDFWFFDPVADKWTQVADIPMRRMNAIAFSSHGNGFVGTGFYNKYSKNIGVPELRIYPGDILKDVWAYDTTSNTWAKKNDFPGGKRMGMSVFSIGDTAYTIAGAAGITNYYWPSNTDSLQKDVWAYNTITDTWVQKPDFPGGERRYTIAGAVSNKAYTGSGGANDLWEYLSGLSLLPVTLVSFTGTVRNNKATLQWTAENEQNIDRYEVHESMDGNAFITSGEVRAVNKKQYTYEDNLFPAAQKLYYRLRMVDHDGSFRYSKVIIVTNSTGDLHIAGFYPSPLTGNTGYLNISSGRPQRLEVAVTDITGHILQTRICAVIAGANNIALPFGKLTAGVYLLTITDERKASHTLEFIKK